MDYDPVQDAINRVRGYLGNYDSDQPAEILADILHYCRTYGLDFDEQVYTAEGYVNAELMVMGVEEDA